VIVAEAGRQRIVAGRKVLVSKTRGGTKEKLLVTAIS
jgi:hypothetical protein